jgi:hypothetical protein
MPVEMALLFDEIGQLGEYLRRQGAGTGVQCASTSCSNDGPFG